MATTGIVGSLLGGPGPFEQSGWLYLFCVGNEWQLWYARNSAPLCIFGTSGVSFSLDTATCDPPLFTGDVDGQTAIISDVPPSSGGGGTDDGDCCPDTPNTLTCAVSLRTGDCSTLPTTMTFTRAGGEWWLADSDINGVFASLFCGNFGADSWDFGFDGVAQDGTATLVSFQCDPLIVIIDYAFGTGGVCTGTARFTFSG